MEFISNILSIYPLTIAQASVLYSILDLNPIGFIFFIFLVIDNYINVFLKYLFSILSSSNSPNLLRPNSNSNPNFKNCTFFCISPGSAIGMPSGHAQSSFMIFAFFALFLYEKYINDTSSTLTKILAYSGIFILFIISILICVQRVMINCHTSLQVIYGGVIGLFLGISSYYLIKLIMYYIVPDELYKTQYTNQPSLLFSMSIGFSLLLLFITTVVVVFYVFST